MIFKIAPIKEITREERVLVTKTRKLDEPWSSEDKLQPARSVPSTPHIPSKGSPRPVHKAVNGHLRGNPGGGDQAHGLSPP